MFDFFAKHKKPLFEGLCDIHNHLLPAIDDGSKSVGMSLKMLEKFDALGFTSVIPTPHVYQELYPNTPTTIKNAFDELTAKTSKIESPKVSSYGAEYMIDEVFMKNLQTCMPSLLLKDEYILVEITFFSETTILVEAGFTLLQNNITPILAHPERYHSINTIKEYKELKNKGFLMQLNALSLLGHYGPEVKQKAEKLLKEGLYDFVATDAHNPQHLKNLQNLSLSKKQGIQWEAIREFQLAEFY
jgi:protein-tyrosine phosphatase|tara:strand:+ start:170 stop:901 length:732 start_codon:yes stop_codon:yes gene_type:complete